MRALCILATLSILIPSARCLADPLVPTDDFDHTGDQAYVLNTPLNDDGVDNDAGENWGGEWGQAFGDGDGKDFAKAEIREDGANRYLLVEGAGVENNVGTGGQNGVYANAARRDILGGSLSGGVLEFQFDLRVIHIDDMTDPGDAIDIYVNGGGSTSQATNTNVSFWMSYRPNTSVSESLRGNWLLRKGVADEDIWQPNDPPHDDTYWIDTGVPVVADGKYTIAARITLDGADSALEAWINDGGPTVGFDEEDGLGFFEQSHPGTRQAGRIIWSVKERTDTAAATAFAIDNIGPITIPEPATGSLLFGGALAAWSARRRYRRRRRPA